MDKIRERRQELGITQQALARKIGVTQSFIAQLEAGTKAPGAVIARKLSDALGIPREYFRPDVFGNNEAA